MEHLPLGRIAALVSEFAVKDLPLGRTHDDDDHFQIPKKVFQKNVCVYLYVCVCVCVCVCVTVVLRSD